MPIAKISKALISSVQALEKETCYWDDSLKGFGLRVHPTGRKIYIVRGRDKAGKQFLTTIGNASLLDPQEARDEAKLIILDSIKEPPQPEFQSPLFRDFAQTYLEDHAKPHKKSWKTDEQRLNQYLIPEFGILPLTLIKRPLIARFNSTLGKDTPYLANRLVELLSKMFEVAALWGYFPEALPNPARKIDEFEENPRDRFLTRAEYERMEDSLVLEDNPVLPALFRLYILTGMRKRELTGLKWEDVCFESKRIKLKGASTGEGNKKVKGTKNGATHYMHLSSQAEKILKSLPRRSDNPYCFVGQKTGRPICQIDKAWQRIRKRAKLEDVVIHDLRRTAASWMAQAGVPLRTIGVALNQKSPKATEIYALLADENLVNAVDALGARMESMGRI